MNDLHCKEPGPISQAKGDPPEKILGLYLAQAEKSDKENSESWRANTDGVLVFVRITLQLFRLYSILSPVLLVQTGVFSATVAAFIIVSYPSLQPDAADSTVRLLSQISQQLTALSNGTPLPAPLILPDAASFKPTPAAVRVNVLWFVSLSISTGCALWATLMQQWARRYVQIADRPDVSQEQARIRAFFAKGVETFGLATAVEVLPVLLHASVLFFYVGLVDFLLHINYTVGFTLLVLVALSVLAYFILSIMPLFWPNSPYLTPLSMVIWFVIKAVPLIKLWFLKRGKSAEKRWNTIKQGMDKALEGEASRTWEMDSKLLHQTLLSLDDDHKMEDFLDGLPEIFSNTSDSANMRKTLGPHVVRVTHRLLSTCTGTTDLHESVRRQRMATCLDAICCFPQTIKRHLNVVWDHWAHSNKADDPWGSLSNETWEMATKVTADSDPVTALHAYCVQALIAVMRQHGRWNYHKEEWAAQLKQQLDTSADVIERHLDSKGNYLQLAIAANLLTNALPLLRKIEAEDGVDPSIKEDVKVILDKICEGLDVSDVPEDLQIPFVDGAKVSEVFRPGLRGRGARRAPIDMTGPWTKVFTPGTASDIGEDGPTHVTGRKSVRSPKHTVRRNIIRA
jgi:hypothetical protein